MNTLEITLDGQKATIKANFSDVRAGTYFRKIANKFDGKTGFWSGHQSWLGEKEYLPALLQKYQGNCVVVSAPAEIIEKYNLTIYTAPKIEKSLFDYSPTAQAVEMLGKMTDEQYEKWNERELKRQKYNNPKPEYGGPTYYDDNTQIWDD